MLQILKLVCLERVLYNKRNHRNKKTTHHNQNSSSRSPQLEKVHMQQQSPSEAKNK